MTGIFVTGASGLVGARIVPAALEKGWDVAVSSRDPDRHAWPAGVTAVEWDGFSEVDLPPGTDAVVNLAGASIGGKRWSKKYQKEMRESRLQHTHGVTQAIEEAGGKAVLVNASAVGYYGRWPAGPCPETRPPGDDYLAELAHDWEHAALAAPGRVVRFRFGHVLDGTGGLLERLHPIYRARIAGPLGSGKQPMPWVHHEDLVRAVLWAIEGDASGAYNLVSPDIRPYRRFHKAIEAVWGRQIGAPVPESALRLAAGGIAPFLTGGQEAVPAALTEAGFRFKWDDLDAAMQDAAQV